MQPDLIEVVDGLCQIIEEQNTLISRLFELLAQHVSTDELENISNNHGGQYYAEYRKTVHRKEV